MPFFLFSCGDMCSLLEIFSFKLSKSGYYTPKFLSYILIYLQLKLVRRNCKPCEDALEFRLSHHHELNAGRV